MTHLFGKRWANNYGPADDGAWLHYLKELFPRDINRGINRITKQKHSFVPSLPEFKTLCMATPEDYGLPPVDLAWNEACQHCHAPDEHDWSHIAVRNTAKTIGWSELRARSHENYVRNIFRTMYQQVVAQIMQGNNAVSAPQTLTHKNEAEQVDIQSEIDVQKTMQKQGIDPKSGRKAFTDVMKGL